MLRRFVRTCLLVTLPTLGCQKPPVETIPPAEAQATPPAPEQTPAEPLPPAEELLTQAVDAAGGKAAFEAITSSYTKATSEVRGQGITIVTESWTKGDDYYSVGSIPGLGDQEQWRKGDEFWSKDPVFGFRKLEGKELAQARWVAEGPLLAASWQDYFASAQTTGRTDDGLLEVTLSAEDGDTVVLHIDPQSHLLVGMAFEQVSPMGAIPVRNRMSDFREVDGVKIPFETIMEVQMQTMVTKTEAFDIGVEIEDAKLEPPGPDGQKPAAEPEEAAKPAKKGSKAPKSKKASKG
ncbi:MAG: hypothetical protein KDK70_36245 [Myxococcales bacterium]|nr:hypothetical protein [Myxococcales bacterium]